MRQPCANTANPSARAMATPVIPPASAVRTAGAVGADIVAGYAIETPRLLLNSTAPHCPHGLGNRSGLVGKNLMVQLNQDSLRHD
jgi:choline dehydrogenase-like flavoprotein